MKGFLYAKATMPRKKLIETGSWRGLSNMNEKFADWFLFLLAGLQSMQFFSILELCFL